MGYSDFHQHSYKVTRLSKPGRGGKEVSSQTVIGSRRAFAEQQNLEEQGLPCAIFNLTKGGVEEYRTGEDDEV